MLPKKQGNFRVNFKCMNWTVLIIVGVALIVLVVFLVWRNTKDEKEFEQQQNNDYHKTIDAEGDIETEEKLK